MIVATTTVGTTTSDYLTRTAGLGYLWTSIILFSGVVAVLAAWYFTLGSVNVNQITNRKAETYYTLFDSTVSRRLPWVAGPASEKLPAVDL